MANQIIIDIGAAANDGTGDPLRTAFNYVNNNFSNVWNTGLPNSNVQFNNNRILTVNTNANLVLAPNGIGVVQSNVSILPNIDRAHDLGSAARKWNTVNTYYVNANVANVGSFGNLTVAVANLHITGGSNGYVLQTDGAGNLTWTAQTGGSGNNTPGGANTQVQFNNAGNLGGSPAFTFNNTSNVLTVSGNISAAYISVANNVNVNNDMYAKRGSFTGDPITGDASLYVGSPTFTNLGTDVMAQFTGNVPAYAQINLQNYSNSNTASGDYIITSDNGNDTTHFLDLGLAGSNWDGSEPNSLGNRVMANDGYLYVQDGNLVVGTVNGSINAWKFGTDGNLTIPGDIIGLATIDIDNRATGNSADINLYSADDILLQARDRTAGSGSEGGDINIFAGDSAEDGDSSGGDVVIEAGNGGAANVDYGGSGGTIRIQTGQGGAASTGVSGQGAYGGGELILRASDAGSNMGNIDRGADGGSVVIEAGDSTGNLAVGGSINLRTGAGGADAAAGSVIIDIPTSDQGPGGEWIFSGTGQLLTVPQNAEIYQPNFGNLTIGAAGNTIITSSDYVANTYTWTFSSEGRFTAPGDVEIGTGDTGVQLRSNQTNTGFYAGIANITNGLSTVVVTLNDVEFGEGDQGTVSITGVEGETEANGFWGWQAVEVDQIQLYTDGTLSTPVNGTTWSAYVSGGVAVSSGYNNLDIQGGSVAIISGAGKYWSFAPNGNLNLPQGGIINEGPSPSFLGDAVTITPANGSDADQQLKIYPTFVEGNHLHLTTGNLYNTEMYVGDDNLYVKLANTGNVVINSNDNTGNTAQWTFGTNGVITLPGEGVLQSIDDTVTLRSFNTSTGNANVVYLGTSGGLGFSDQEIGGNWLEIFRSGTEPQIGTTVGNLVIQTSSNATPYNWTFGSTGDLTTPGSVINTPVALGNLTAVAGARAFASDANLVATGNFGAQVSGGAGNIVPVWSDGANWYIG